MSCAAMEQLVEVSPPLPGAPEHAAGHCRRCYLSPPTRAEALLVVFSGHFPDASAKGYEVPFEFQRFLSRHPLGVNVLLLRDPSMSWYLQGIESLGHSVEALAEFVRAEQRQLQCCKLYTLGSSMGGYAALLFGHLLQADVALAFGPQIYLDEAKRREVGVIPYEYEPRLKEVEAMCRERGLGKYIRLTNLLPLAIGKVHIHLGQNESSDINQAMGLNDQPNVKFTVWPGGNHMVVKALRDEGKLLPVLRRLFAPPGIGPEAESLTSNAKEVEVLRMRGNELVKAGNWSQAADLYTEALQAGPSAALHHQLLANRSLCLLRLGQPVEAWHDADAALRLEPKYTKALYRRAQCEVDRGLLASAARSVAEALLLEPKDPALRVLEADLARRGAGGPGGAALPAGPPAEAPFAGYCE